MKNVYWAFKMGIKSRPAFIIVIIISYISLHILNPLSSIIIKKITNLTEINVNFTYKLLILIILYVLAASFRNIQYSFSMLFIENIENSLSQKIQKQFFNAVNKTNLKKLDQPDYLEKVYRARNMTWYTMANILNNGFHTLGLAISASVSMVLVFQESVIYVLPIIAICILNNITANKQVIEMIKKNRKVDSLNRKLQYTTSLLTEKNNLQEIRTYQSYEWLVNKWKSIFNDIKNSELKFMVRWMRIDTIVEILSIIFDNLLLLLMVYGIFNKSINIGSLILIINSKNIIIESVNTIVQTIIDLKDDDSYLCDLREVLQRDDSFKVDPLKNDEILSLSKVSFSYQKDKQVLNDITMSLKKGQLVALVGENGSGKSSLAKIAIGLLKSDTGTVAVDRNGISAAYQDFIRFELSIRENIGFGKIDEIDNDNMIYDAIEKGDCNDILNKLDNDLSKVLGKSFDQDGHELSGGQWQRIAISRAFMGTHSMIVFDEPSSNLDPIAEMRQFEQIKRNMNSSGGIIISHRVGIARLADYIIFLEHGEIAESGTHEELISFDSKYKRFFDSQAQWYHR